MRAGAFALALCLPGCVTGSTKDPGGNPERGLAVRPSSLPPPPPGRTGPPPASASAAGGSRPPGPPAASRPPGGSVSRSARPPSGGGAPAAPYHRAGATSDAANDAGPTTPAYADAVLVTVEDDGRNARVTVTLRGDVPSTLPAAETMGLGVDFFRSATQTESDYQLFADGEPDGWYAYLQGPKGFVKYPGTFGIGDRRVVFTVPWASLGGPSSGYFATFVDWTRDATPVNLSGEDHAPDLGNAAFSR